jgi:hypothetical protein
MTQLSFSQASALLVAGFSSQKANKQTRLSTQRFFEAYSNLAPGSGLSKPDWKDTKHKKRLRKWAKKNNLSRVSTQRDPKKWGPPTWQFLLDSSQKFTLGTKALFWSMLKNLGPLLPCPECRKNYTGLIDEPRWSKVKSAKDCREYIQWMREKVASRKA